MQERFGSKRVIEPKHVLPTSAWRLDNSRTIFSDEMRISIEIIHLEGTNFKQIGTEADDNEEKIRQKIMDTVIRRGKLHNPVTNTGGLIYGVIDEIGTDFENPMGLKVGDAIICNGSTTSFPMHIESIVSIDKVYSQISATGYAIIHDKMSIIKVEPDMPVNLLMFALDESGTLFRLHKELTGQQKFLVLGNNILTNLLYGHVIRRMVGPQAEIICAIDKRTGIKVRGKGIDQLSMRVFDQVHYLDALKPLEALEILDAYDKFDLSVNCAEIPGAETINVLATKPGGTVLFANLINNLNIALYITESVSKHLNIIGAEGYLEGYDLFDIQITKELWEYFESTSIAPNQAMEEIPVEENPYIRELMEKSLSEDFVCVSRPMRTILGEIMNVSKYDCNVIIFGETGVGKEKVANLIQKNSERKMQPFVKINCGAISPNLIESEFFGYEKGAFTGASSTGKKGYFEMANNGVMFLDEVGELPLEMQAKLLRVLQDGEFYRVGGTSPIKTNVRLISATNRNLEDLVADGKFRRDLYYRLNVVPIQVPLLSERPEDIPFLINHFINKYSKKFGTRRGIVDSAVEYLTKLPWPGNVRELENLIQRLIISSKGEDITLMDVMRETHNPMIDAGFAEGDKEFGEGGQSKIDSELNLQKAVDDYEKGLIKYACDKYGSTRKAAKAIGISQTQLVRKKKKYSI